MARPRKAPPAALAVVGQGQGDVLALALPVDAAGLASLQAEAEAMALATVGLECPDRETYDALDASLTEVVTMKDGIVAMRTEATQAADRAVRGVRATLRPILAPLESAEIELKRAMGGFLAEQAQAQEAARQAAAEAAETGDAETLTEALTTAAELDAGPTAARWFWAVDRIVEDLLPDEYWIPDKQRIAVHATKAGSAEEIEAIPGVVFKRLPLVAGRR
jgi:hypothetical protein